MNGFESSSTSFVISIRRTFDGWLLSSWFWRQRPADGCVILIRFGPVALETGGVGHRKIHLWLDVLRHGGIRTTENGYGRENDLCHVLSPVTRDGRNYNANRTVKKQ